MFFDAMKIIPKQEKEIKSRSRSEKGKAGKKGQLKIQETAFMLLALAIFGAIVLLFYTNMQLRGIYSERERLAEEEAISSLEKFVGMPEFAVETQLGHGIDKEKLLALRNISDYSKLFESISKIEVYEITENKSFEVYNSKKQKNIAYSMFVPLCSTKYVENYAEQDCKVAQLIVWVEKK